MKLTTKSEYSLLALIYIARYEEKGFININEICTKYNIPKKYLEYLLSALKQNGYVKAKRGIGGGYKLARPAEKINVAQIVRLMDGALAPTHSVSTFFFSHTPLEQEKKITKVFRDIRNFIAQKLENLRLSDLI